MLHLGVAGDFAKSHHLSPGPYDLKNRLHLLNLNIVESNSTNVTPRLGMRSHYPRLHKYKTHADIIVEFITISLRSG